MAVEQMPDSRAQVSMLLVKTPDACADVLKVPMFRLFFRYPPKLSLVVALLVAIPLVVAPVTPARAAADDVVTIQGGGYGHGVGMSQYGAHGYALVDGWGWEQILETYYTGVVFTQVGTGGLDQVDRILVGIDPDETVIFLTPHAVDEVSGVDGFITIVPTGQEVALEIGQKATIRISGGTCTVKITDADTGAEVYTTEPSGCDIRVEWDGDLESPTTRMEYAGDTYTNGVFLVKKKPSEDKIHLVGDLKFEHYLDGIAEMPSWFHPQALAAQAVAARSYAANKVATRTHPSLPDGGDYWKNECWCEIRSTIFDQVYSGDNDRFDDWFEAVDLTVGMVITHPQETYAGKLIPISAFYSSSTFGHTESAAIGFGSANADPWLVGVPDPASGYPEVNNSKFYRWTAERTADEVATALGFETITDARITEFSPSGAASKVEFSGQKNGSATEQTYSTASLRSKLSLLSGQITSISISDPTPPPPDTSGPWGPFPSAEEFVRQQYRDFLGREGETAGVAFWAGHLVSEGMSPEQVIDEFMGSAEFGQRIAPVVRLYSATFLRLPDYDGLLTWANASRSGWTLEQIADEFTTSTEFQNRYGDVSDAEFVTLLYNNVLGRDPDAGGLADWVGRLESGQSRGSILVGFSESVEYRAASEHEVVVTMAYVGMLRRAPEPGGFEFWVDKMDTGMTRISMMGGFFRSIEYANRFQ